MRYRVDAQWVDVTLEGNPKHLPYGALLPQAAEQDAQFSFVPGPHGLPRSFHREPVFAEADFEGTIRSVTWGEVLPKIEPWPMPGREDLGRSDDRFLAGESDEAFGMGLTFLEGYEGLLSKSEEANALAQAACALHTNTYYGAGARWTVPALGLLLGEGDWIAFQLRIYSDSGFRNFEVEYKQDGGLVAGTVTEATGEDLFGGVEDVSSGTTALRCPLRSTRPILGATDALHAAWTLGLDGVPCSIRTRPIVFREAGAVRPIPAGETVEFPISPPITNIGWDHAIGWDPVKTGQVAYDVEDGRLAWIAPWNPEDLRAVDVSVGPVQSVRATSRSPSSQWTTGGLNCMPCPFNGSSEMRVSRR